MIKEPPVRISSPNYEATHFREELECVLNDVSAIAKEEGKKTGFCVGNTTKKIDRDYFFTPIRNTSLCVAGSVIIDRIAIAEEIAKSLDGRVDYIFVDTEKKISPERYGVHDAGNVERTMRRLVKKSKVLTYKGNDLIVDSLDCFLAQRMAGDERGLGGKKVAIIGAGNIGFKIALKLTERGAHVFLARRDSKKLSMIVQTLNLIKPKNTIARVHGTTSIQKAMVDADVVIGLTPGTGDITAAKVKGVKPNALLIDVGKGSFSKDAIETAESFGVSVYRSSIIASFEGQIAMLLKMEEILEQASGRTVIDGVPVIAGGIVGRTGEIVVDDLNDPKQIYGIADGSGDFNRNPTSDEKLRVERLSKAILEKKNPA